MYFLKECEIIKKDEQEYFLLNLINGALDIIDGDLFEKIINENFQEIESDIIDALKSRNYLFDSEKEYLAFIKRINCEIQQAEKKSVPNFLLIPSYNCNLNCIYCYEHTYEMNCKNKERDLNLVDTQFNIINEIIKKQNVQKEDYEKIRITIMGGEPLLIPNKDVVEKIIKKAEQYGYSVDIVTNGVDLDKFIKILTSKTVKNIQITVDGPKEIHDKRRVFYDGRGSFDQIFKNLKLALDNNIEVFLRLNADDANISQISELSDLLVNMGHYPNLHPYIYLLQDGGCSGESNVLKEAVGLEKIYSIQKTNNNANIFYIKSHIYPLINSILNNKAFVPRLKHCGASGNQFILDEKLLVYKCWHGIGNEKYSIGKYDEKGLHLKEELVNSWMNRDASCMQKCKDCKYRYLCGTGCPAATHEVNKIMNTSLPFCPDFKEILPVTLNHYFN